MTSTLSIPEKGREFYLGRESLFGSGASNPEQKTCLQREIEATDRQIDQIVYELYGLTKDEIQIIEEMTCPVSR